MNQIMVVYWSQTGNTEAMANAVAEGIRKAGKDALVTEVSNISADALKDAGVFALGCPAMGAEVLEESEMDPFVAEVETFASGKHIGLFGSYGWGDGEWMRDWQASLPRRVRAKMHSISAGSWERLWRPQKHSAES